MELTFEKDQIIELIKKYYENVEFESVSIDIKPSKQLEGYGQSEHYVAKAYIKVAGEKDIDGMKVKYEKTLTKGELETIFGYVLKRNNYNLVNLQINCILKNDEVQFQGIVIKVEPVQQKNPTKR